MIEPVVIGILILAVLACVGWLGGGRKWAFRTTLAALALVAIGVAGTLTYGFWTEKSAERRAKKIHECAIAKVADPPCLEKDSDGSCNAYPAYMLFDNPTPEQEENALSVAEQECRAEMDPQQKSLHDQLSDYRRQHATVVKSSETKGDVFDKLAAKDAKGNVFDQVIMECAAKVRKKYPRAYDDLDDETLVKKVLAKYPHYCIAGEGDPPGWQPVIQGIR